MKLHNFFDTMSLQSEKEEVIETILEHSGCKIERIVSNGFPTPEGEWFEQNSDEWVILLSGTATIVYKEKRESVAMEQGDFLFIPANVCHRVEKVSKLPEALWLAVHLSN